jgi:phage FluMu protein Com
MAIEFRCTQCNKLLRTADESAGKKAKCPECGQILRVPALETAAPGQPLPPSAEPQEAESSGPAAGAEDAAAEADKPSSGGFFGKIGGIFRRKKS